MAQAKTDTSNKTNLTNIRSLKEWVPALIKEQAEKDSNQTRIGKEDMLFCVYDASYSEGSLLGKVERKNPEESYSIETIEQSAEYASKMTGVRKDFIMGMLVVESDLGRNTGKCTYGQVESGAYSAYNTGRLSQSAWRVFQKRTAIFKDISEELGYNYEELKVSCNPAQYYGTGGAMGIPQFMPDTWLAYKDRISAMTGKENPDPWNVTDGVMAMALKLSDVPGVKSHNRGAERNAAKIYLSGGTASKYNWYADKIIYWASNYRYLIG